MLKATTLMLIALSLAGCMSLLVASNEKDCKQDRECEAHEDDLKDLAREADTIIAIGVAEAIIDAAKAEPVPEPSRYSDLCREPDQRAICSAISGCYCTQVGTDTEVNP